MSTRMRRAVCTLLAGAGVLAAVAGCGGGAEPAASQTHAGHEAPSGTSSGASADMSGMGDMNGMDGMDGAALWAVQKSGGTVMVTDGEGHPLYRSDADGNTPPRSACAGACAAEWQPVTLGAGQSADLLGIQRSAVGTLRRADGTTQLTLRGSPLYRHAGEAQAQPDPRAFVARGWFVVTPTGERVTG